MGAHLGPSSGGQIQITKQKANIIQATQASVYRVCIFAFLRVFIWQPDDDPKCAPRHVTLLQYINSCVGTKVYMFIKNDNIKQLDGNHSIKPTLA